MRKTGLSANLPPRIFLNRHFPTYVQVILSHKPPFVKVYRPAISRYNTDMTTIYEKVYNDITIKIPSRNPMDRRRGVNFFGEDAYLTEIEKLIKGMLVYDIGAAIGSTSLRLACWAREVHAFEPDSTHYERLLETININPDLPAKIHPHKIAISEIAGTTTLFTDFSTNGPCPSLTKGKHKRSEIVDSLPLSAFSPADAIKIDVEGHEEEVVRSLNYNPLLLFIEFHSGFKFDITLLQNYTKLWDAKRGTEHLTIWRLQ